MFSSPAEPTRGCHVQKGLFTAGTSGDKLWAGSQDWAGSQRPAGLHRTGLRVVSSVLKLTDRPPRALNPGVPLGTQSRLSEAAGHSVAGSGQSWTSGQFCLCHVLVFVCSSPLAGHHCLVFGPTRCPKSRTSERPGFPLPAAVPENALDSSITSHPRIKEKTAPLLSKQSPGAWQSLGTNSASIIRTATILISATARFTLK